MRRGFRRQLAICITFFVLCFSSHNLLAQQSASNPLPSGQARQMDPPEPIQEQLRRLQQLVEQMNVDHIHDRARADAEIADLRQQLQDARQRLGALEDSLKPTPPLSADKTADHEEGIQKLKEDQELVAAKVDEQYETKVESGSKYRLKLSGMLLINLFNDNGKVEHIETPSVALPRGPLDPGGSFGGSIRQSQVSLQTFGPTVAGARVQGDLVFDMFGEFPDTVNGFTSGALRLRTGTMRLDWGRTSLIAGQDGLFFSQQYPTSFAAVAQPPLAYSGNLYGWIPQLRVEHRWSTAADSTVTLSAGIFDPLTGEVPTGEFLRTPGAGESSRQPGFGTGIVWTRKFFGQPLTIGTGGYFSRENWGFNRNIKGWAATTDWNIPLGSLFGLSGKFYDGQAIGGLGGSFGQSVLFNGPIASPGTQAKGLHSTGGWLQVKFKPNPKLEFNTAVGEDQVAAADLRGFTVSPPSYFSQGIGFPVGADRNQTEFANFIFRPRSDLLFSTEYRTIRTFSVDGTSQRASQINFIMGVFF